LTLSVGIGARERREDTEESRAVRIEKISGAVRRILECIGEDPNREGLLKTPERYAKALMFFSKGYEESITRKSLRRNEKSKIIESPVKLGLTNCSLTPLFCRSYEQGSLPRR